QIFERRLRTFLGVVLTRPAIPVTNLPPGPLHALVGACWSPRVRAAAHTPPAEPVLPPAPSASQQWERFNFITGHTAILLVLRQRSAPDRHWKGGRIREA